MRVLIDECLPRRIQNSLIGHACQTVPLAGFAGKTNGELLTLAEQAGFEVLLTVDKGIQHQQNLIGRKIALLIVRARSNDIDDLLPHVPDCLAALRFIKPGEVVRVS
jgi:predicted nuclease of predicted toxin-antitoxin system